MLHLLPITDNFQINKYRYQFTQLQPIYICTLNTAAVTKFSALTALLTHPAFLFPSAITFVCTATNIINHWSLMIICLVDGKWKLIYRIGKAKSRCNIGKSCKKSRNTGITNSEPCGKPNNSPDQVVVSQRFFKLIVSATYIIVYILTGELLSVLRFVGVANLSTSLRKTGK